SLLRCRAVLIHSYLLSAEYFVPELCFECCRTLNSLTCRETQPGNPRHQRVFQSCGSRTYVFPSFFHCTRRSLFPASRRYLLSRSRTDPSLRPATVYTS